MERYVFSYKNNGKEEVALVIEPWILIYKIKPLSTIVFTYIATERKVELISFRNNEINVYFDFDKIKIVLDGQNITSQYPLEQLDE